MISNGIAECLYISEDHDRVVIDTLDSVLLEYGRGEEAMDPLIIQFDIKTSEFKLGPSCKFHHPLNRLDPFVKLTLAGLPRREVDI